MSYHAPLPRAARLALVALVACALLFAGALRPAPAAAVGCVVTSTADTPTGGTLREKLADSTCDAITFQAGVTGTITLASTLPTVSRTVSVTGPGAASLTVDRNAINVGLTAAFAVGSGGDLSLTGLTVRGGFSGLDIASGHATVAASVFAGNAFGIQVRSGGGVTVTGSTFSGNTSTGLLLITGASATVVGSTFNNTSTGLQFGSGGSATVLNSTFAANAFAGIYFAGGGGATVLNSTLVGNAHNIRFFDGSATLTNTLLAQGSGANCLFNGGILSNTASNLADDASCFADNSGAGGTSRVRTTAQLGLDPVGLHNNGGPTQTVALTATSAALDAGDNDICQATGADKVGGVDQRGAPRPVGACDIGAFERGAVVPCLVTSTADSGTSSLRAVIADPSCPTITFALPDPSTITLTSDQLFINRDLTIIGPGAAQLTVARSAAQGTPQFRVAQVNIGVTAAISGLTFAGGDLPSDGGGILSQGNLTLTDAVVRDNHAGNVGGGIEHNGAGTLVLTGVTLADNTALQGGGVNVFSSTLVATNVTVSGNTASGSGGGINNGNSSTTTLTNVTVSGNSAGFAGGVSTASTLHATRTIIAGNSAGSFPDTNGINGTNVANLVGGTPLLAPLGDYGGPTPTRPPLPGSPAIDAGGATCSATDQRGLARPVTTACDIGAVESRGFVFSLPTGGGQSTTFGTAFASPLTVTVTGNLVAGAIREPVDGGVVTLTGPATGASIAATPTTATIPTTGSLGDGIASASVAANGTAGGPYTVTASASGTTGTATYGLTNLSVACVVTTTADSGAGSLREKVGIANAGNCTGDTITFNLPDPSTITLTTGQLTLTHAVTITGPGATQLTVARNAAIGTPQFRIFEVGAVTASISGLTLTGGDLPTNAFGGGIFVNSGGTLTLDASVLTGNHANYGGGIGVFGTLSATNVTVRGNTVTGAGGGVLAFGAVTLTNVTVSGNSSPNTGGGIYVPVSGTLALTNSTISGNSATIPDGGGGIRLENAAVGTLTNVTVSANTGGGISVVNTAVLNATRSIIAGNTAANLNGSGINGTNANNLTSGNPLLAPLGDYGGPTPTMAPLPGSPAIDAGGATCSATDQRGLARPVSTNCDIGAVESRGFTLSRVAGGDGQSAVIGFAFANPLAVTVTGNLVAGAIHEPVQGGAITFTGPASGASIAATPATATIDATGQASIAANANGTVGGPYSVVAAAAGAASGVSFALTNLTTPVTLVAADASGVYSGTATLSATLTATTGGAGLAGKTIAFTLGGAPVGTAATNASGVATLSNASLAGIGAGTYPTGVGVSFAGDATTAAAADTAQLAVAKAATALTQVRGDATYGDTAATLTATLRRTDGDGGPVAGATVAFTLNGAAVCGGGGQPACPTTNAQGVATLAGIAIPAGLNAGSYANAVGASFAGDANHLASQGSGPLKVGRRILTLKATDRTVGLRQPNPPTAPPANCLAQATATSACWLELAPGSAFLPGDGWGDLNLANLRFTYSRNYPSSNAAETVGKTYKISATGFSSANYDLRFVQGTLTVVAP